MPLVALPGSLNDLNVADRSRVVHEFVKGPLSSVSYKLNGTEHKMAYNLADGTTTLCPRVGRSFSDPSFASPGIYDDKPIYMKTISQPKDEKQRHYAQQQEAARKDVERSFGVLLSRWGYLHEGCRLWYVDDVEKVWKTCMILHNLIVEDESDLNLDDEFPNSPLLRRGPSPDLAGQFYAYLKQLPKVLNRHDYFLKRNDLVEEMWHRLNTHSEDSEQDDIDA